MHLEAFYDFYFLETLKSMGLDEFNKPQAKLIEDLDEWHTTLTDNLALAIRDYLYLACFGEARHASTRCALHWPQNHNGLSRLSSYQIAITHNLVHALPKLIQIFDQSDWGGGYGGKIWRQIAEAAAQYGIWPNTLFIDHAIDLEHHNGFVFSKYDAASFINWNFHSEIHNNIKTWLTIKSQNDLIRMPTIDTNLFTITQRTAGLIDRYHTIKQLKPPSWWATKNIFQNTLDYTPYQWGNEPIPELSSRPLYSAKFFKAAPEFTKDCLCVSCVAEQKSGPIMDNLAQILGISTDQFIETLGLDSNWKFKSQKKFDTKLAGLWAYKEECPCAACKKYLKEHPEPLIKEIGNVQKIEEKGMAEPTTSTWSNSSTSDIWVYPTSGA